MYELYRASIELPNRQIHLLLPTTKGLFYLNERIEDATDVLNGLVYGEFYLEDFHLHASHRPSSAAATTNKEFMLFSVAVLNENSTPQLIANYLQQNFHILPHEITVMDQMPIHHAVCLLPKAVDQDLCQLKLLPHVQRMQCFNESSKRIALVEQQQERERVLRIAYYEKKQAKLEQKKKQNQFDQQNGKPSQKVRRALAYFQYLCDTTSNPKTPRACEERLEKLWQCFQLLDEWKICKGGRLIDAETTDDTLRLLKLHQEATAAAFDQVLETKSQGPLLYPILCLGGDVATRKLVVKIGIRLGATEQENREYGLLLDLDQEFDDLENATPVIQDEDRHKMKKRGLTKKSLALLAQEEDQKIASALSLCADVEWKARDLRNANATLFTNTDLLRPPFYHFKWSLIAKAYKQAMRVVVCQIAKLEAFNALAKVLQNTDAILGKVEIEKWQREADKFLATLSDTAPGAGVAVGCNSNRSSNVLAQAARRILVKKGAALLTKRARLRKQQIRDREEELIRLKKVQEENDLPKLSAVQQMKLAFIKEKAPQIQAALELTPAEKLMLKASHVLDKVAATATSVAAAAKKEYAVRSL